MWESTSAAGKAREERFVKLETSSGHRLQMPSAADVGQALESLTSYDSFIVLSTARQFYLQAAGTWSRGFLVECRLGSESLHFTAAQDPLPSRIASELFQLYAQHDDAWRTHIAWKGQDGKPRTPPAPSARSSRSVIGSFGPLQWVFVVLTILCIGTFARSFRGYPDDLQRASGIPTVTATKYGTKLFQGSLRSFWFTVDGHPVHYPEQLDGVEAALSAVSSGEPAEISYRGQELWGLKIGARTFVSLDAAYAARRRNGYGAGAMAVVFMGLLSYTWLRARRRQSSRSPKPKALRGHA